MHRAPCVVVVDRTHLDRRASGIERITRDLFSDESLAPLPVEGTASGGDRLRTMLRQMVGNPLQALRRSRSLWLFPGFPPSPAFAWMADRSVLYVHDLFLIERAHDLNRAGRLYLAPSFRMALRHFRYFLANSATTAEKLRPYIGERAAVMLYRPPVHDTMGLGRVVRATATRERRPVVIGMMGTIEPRKNYPAAIAIRAALQERLSRPVELHVVGRAGWGSDAALLAGAEGVRCHDFVEDGALPTLVAQWDAFLSTSHDEGLGLPLLEMQHAGLPIVAPDQPVFREVLGNSGSFFEPGRPADAVARLVEVLRDSERDRARQSSARNIARWNALALADRHAVLGFLSERLAALQGPPAA